MVHGTFTEPFCTSAVSSWLLGFIVIIVIVLLIYFFKSTLVLQLTSSHSAEWFGSLVISYW